MRLSTSSAAGRQVPFSKRYIGGGNALAHDVHIRLNRARDKLRGRSTAADGSTVLIHIPKCAGVSLRHALEIRNPGHRLLCDHDSGELRAAKRIVFCTRDPFDRLVSAYFYARRLSKENPFRYIFSGFSPAADFTEFVQSDDLPRLEAYHYFFRSQFQYLNGIESYANKSVHLRFDRLEEDFERHFGVTLPAMNAAATDRTPPGVDTPENRERVRHVYRADYELLPKLIAS